MVAPPVAERVWEWVEDDTETAEIGTHETALERLRASEEPSADRSMFELLADELEDIAAGLASPRKAMHHPAYKEILALGFEAVPWIVARIEQGRNRPLWMRVLGSLTGLPPSRGADTVTDAAHAWLLWSSYGARIVDGT